MKLERARSGVLKINGPLKDALGAEIKARMVPRGDEARVAACIDRYAPPGNHEAVLSTQDGDYPVTIEVPAKARLRLRPSSVDITGRPGDKIQLDLVVRNLGNVDMKLPSGGISGLFASDGLAGAFSAAYGSNAEAPLDVFGEFINGLRRSHMGLARLRLTAKQDGPLKPGESREVIGNLTLPQAQDDQTQTGAGRRFNATFVMDRLRFGVRLTLDAPATKGKTQ